MGSTKLTIATRASRLALIQSEEARQALTPVFPAETRFEIKPLESPGDRDLSIPLSDASVPDDFFTRDLDDALLAGEADMAVHSAKDLPQTLREGLTIAALLPAKDIRDALVFRRDRGPHEPPRVIGTSSPRRDAYIRSMFPEAETRPLRGTIQQRLDRLDAGAFDAIVIAACALGRLGLEDRIGEYLSYDPAPQQGRLALVVRAEDSDLRRALRSLDVRRRAGLVAIVGCPADPAMLSVRAERYLRRADVVLHDRLLPDEVMLLIRNKAIPVGKVGGERSISQADIHRRMLTESEGGKLVVRLHGGDPCIFAHLKEELEFLTAWNLRVDILPTLTAAQVAAAHAHAALTHRGDGGGVKFTTGHTPSGQPQERMPGPDEGNLAVYMGVGSAHEVQDRLQAAGWPAETPLVVGERIGYRDERILNTVVGNLPELILHKPAVFLVGVQSHPSSGYTLFTGTDPEHFLNFGPLIHWPLIKLVSLPLRDRTALLDEHLPSANGIVFPSRFAVHSFMEALLAWRDIRALADKKILSVGPSTSAELETYGLRADGSAESYGGVRSLAERIGPAFEGEYFYPCSDAAPQDERKRSLASHGVIVRPSIFYNNRVVSYNKLPDLPFSRVLFTSTSAVKAYFASYPDERRAERTWLAVGPSTQSALDKLGLDAEVIEYPAGPATPRRP